MKLMPIICSLDSHTKKSSFRGTTKYFGPGTEHYLKLQDTPSGYGTQLHDDYSFQLQYLVPKFAKIDNAFDRRKGRTGKVYIGDPDEVIDLNKILKYHDYAVSDMEPKYPNIDKVSASYFYDDATKYDEYFKAIAEFHDRREAAAKRFEAQYRKNILDGINTEDSKEKVDYYVWQQKDSFAKRRQALEALEIYNKANDLKAVKEELGRNLGVLYSSQKSNEQSLKTTEWAINDGKERLDANKSFVKDLEKREDLYNKIRQLPEDTSNPLELKWKNSDPIYCRLRLTIFENEHKTIDDSIGKIKEFVSAYKKQGKRIEEYIQKEIKEKADIKERLKNLAEEIIQKQKEFDISKGNLIPLFDELKAFYLKHGIKG